jgi:hypothetical protein
MKKILFSLVILFICCDRITYDESIESIANHYSCYMPVPSVLETNLKSYNEDSISLIFKDLPENFKKGLVAYYPFNDSIVDESPNKLNGIVLSDVAENLAKFNDVNDSTYIKIEDNNLLDFTNNFSLCVWFNNNHKSDLVQGILGKLRTDGGNGYSLQFHYFSEDATDPGVINEMKLDPRPMVLFGINQGYYPYGGNCEYRSDDLIIGWHFVVGTYNGEQLKLYIDGEIKDTFLTNVILPNFNSPLYIGREVEDLQYKGTIRYFYGLFDNIMLYDYAISDTLITNLYDLKQ